MKKEDKSLIESSDNTELTVKEVKKNKKMKKPKNKKVKNEMLLKKGSYSIAITAIVLVGLIVFNWLVGVLSDRFNLEVDMTSDKKNSISEENVEYLKSIKDEVNITVCGKEEGFAENMAYYAQRALYVSANSEYFEQTVNLIKKYPAYNDRIKVQYIDMQSTEYTAITSNYPTYDLTFGDLIVSSTINGKERVRVLTFDDIYVLGQDSSSSYSSYSSVTANRLETSLTSAIAYVTSTEIKKAALLTGHSNNSYADAYTELLTINNYEITEISDSIISEISNEYDVIIVSAPSIDFLGSELDAISEFLDNDGKLNKGLMFFADATCPSLPNLYSFLQQWGISVGEGILFETNENNFINKKSTMGIYKTQLEDDDINESIDTVIADYNVPMNVCETSSTKRTSKALMQTLNSVFVAPVGSSNDYTSSDTKQFDSVIQSEEAVYDADNNRLTSYIMAFSSVEFVQSTWASQNSLGNQDITIACTDRAAHRESGVKFTSKVITNESFAADVSQRSVKTVKAIFAVIIPIVMVSIGIYVYVRRKDAR